MDSFIVAKVDLIIISNIIIFALSANKLLQAKKKILYVTEQRHQQNAQGRISASCFVVDCRNKN